MPAGKTTDQEHLAILMEKWMAFVEASSNAKKDGLMVMFKTVENDGGYQTTWWLARPIKPIK